MQQTIRQGFMGDKIIRSDAGVSSFLRRVQSSGYEFAYARRSARVLRRAGQAPPLQGMPAAKGRGADGEETRSVLVTAFWFCREDALDLLEVVEVVAGHHVKDALDGFFAAFGVHAVMLPLFRL